MSERDATQVSGDRFDDATHDAGYYMGLYYVGVLDLA